MCRNFIVVIILSALMFCNIGQDSVNEITNNNPMVLLSANGSSRSTAYIESNKILTHGETTFITYLENGEADSFNVVLVTTEGNNIVQKK